MTLQTSLVCMSGSLAAARPHRGHHRPRWACTSHKSWSQSLGLLTEPSHLGSQLSCKGTVPGGSCASPGELVSGYDTPGRSKCPGSQEDMSSNWKPHSLMADSVSGVKIVEAPCLPPLAVVHLLLCFWNHREQQARPALVFARVQSFVLWAHQEVECSVRGFLGE